jgi:hypothetical protein
MNDDGPIRVLLGNFPIADTISIPVDILRAADAEIGVERARRLRVAEEMQATAATEAARKPGWFARCFSIFRRGEANGCLRAK